MIVRKILVVDDEKKFTDMLTLFFRLKNYQMFTAFDGSQALDILSGESVDLVLLDMEMPGISGMDVLKQLKEKYKNVNVIVITGHEKEYSDSLNKIGVNGIYSKPVHLGVLTQNISNLFNPIS